MKRALVALLATMLMLCWCGTAMAAEVFDFPLTTDEITLPEYMKPRADDLKVEKGSTEWKFTWGDNPFGEEDVSPSVWYYCSTENEWIDKSVNQDDLVKTDTGWSYTWDLPAGFIDDTLSFYVGWYTLNGDYTNYYYQQQYRDRGSEGSDLYKSLSQSELQEDSGLFARVSAIDTLDGEVYSYQKEGITAYYDNGEMDGYACVLDNQQYVSFDIYGRITSCWMFDQELGRTVDWSNNGWYYYDDNGEYKKLDKAPEGAVDPETMEPPYAKPVPEMPVPTTNAAAGMPVKLPVTAADLPNVVSVVEKDGYWGVTLDKGLTESEESVTGFDRVKADVVIWYTDEEEESGGSLLYTWEDGYQDGNTYYLPIVEGMKLGSASVRLDVYDGALTFEVYKENDGYFYGTGYDSSSYYDIYAEYEENGLSWIRYWNPETNASTFWSFDTKTGEVESYRVPMGENFYITYLADGTVSYAYYDVMEEDEDGNSYYVDTFYWNPDDGWYKEVWDEEAEGWVVVPAEAPEGVEEPGKYTAPYVFKQPYSWYPHNTVGVLGLSLRDMYPGLTDKWYNIAPVDLTKEGTQTIPLAASNMYYFGEATVTVADGAVTVEYKLPGGEVFPEGECLQWFKSVDEITTEFLSNPTGGHAFGEAVSISEELGGQDVALLFICNHVTYRQPRTDDGIYLARFYPGQPYVKSWRAYLTELMTVLEPEEAVEAAE